MLVQHEALLTWNILPYVEHRLLDLSEPHKLLRPQLVSMPAVSHIETKELQQVDV
jgi:hypothetical protein